MGCASPLARNLKYSSCMLMLGLWLAAPRHGPKAWPQGPGAAAQDGCFFLYSHQPTSGGATRGVVRVAASAVSLTRHERATSGPYAERCMIFAGPGGSPGGSRRARACVGGGAATRRARRDRGDRRGSPPDEAVSCVVCVPATSEQTILPARTSLDRGGSVRRWHFMPGSSAGFVPRVDRK